MTDDSMIATHSEPVWRNRTNFIVSLDLAEHGAPGRFEQCWTRTEDRKLFELCCIPFFTYGQSLGDILSVDVDTGRHSVHRKGSHRTIRFAFTDDLQAHLQHERIHGALAEDHDCLLELRSGGHYGAIDITTQTAADRVIGILTPHYSAGYLEWEWADPPFPE